MAGEPVRAMAGRASLMLHLPPPILPREWAGCDADPSGRGGPGVTRGE